jgi:hypothetical protein
MSMVVTRLKCTYCAQDFGQEKKYVEHLKSKHYVEDDFILYLKTYHQGVHPTCTCNNECTSKLKWFGWKKGFLSKFARGHNAKLDSCFLNSDVQKTMAEKRVIGYKDEKYKVWNDGLTKESSTKILESSKKAKDTLLKKYASGDLIDWRLLDKEKAASVAQKISLTKKKKYLAGELTSWNLGLTKETNSSVMNTSLALKSLHEAKPGFCTSRLSHKEFVEKLKSVESTLQLVDDTIDYKNKYQRFNFLCSNCNKTQEKSLMMFLNAPFCFSCKPKESKGQIELYDFVKSLCDDAILSDRKKIEPKELDVYVPSRDVAIEYNGLYWHSVKRSSNVNAHQSKHDLCDAAGISLLSVYEDEWRDKRDIIKSMISHRLRLNKKIFARKLKTVKVTQKAAKEFFDQNHLEGYTNSFVTFGLVDESNKLYAAIALRKPFHKKHHDTLEISRSCTLIGFSITGWLGKLTKHIKSYVKQQYPDIKKLMTYVDFRVGSGEGYKSAGWSFIKNDKKALRFWWTDFQNRFNRFKFRANKQLGLSESAVAQAAGVVKIYGCSNSIFEILL